MWLLVLLAIILVAERTVFAEVSLLQLNQVILSSDVFLYYRLWFIVKAVNIVMWQTCGSV